MAIRLKRMDRAQRHRARRIWWERNGAFTRGMLVGVILAGAAAWGARAMGWW